ncbi:MAG: GDP-mannose 4,6-dehydratase [Candidatus Omnitrophica bacterium]|nr:GDP-mannose 4,6-dehydratase [Candidatus Omnitrophota bacterium]
MRTSFWKKKRVLVTGADGFMGSHLTDRLLKEGAHVSVYVRGNSVSGTVGYTLKNIKRHERRLRSILTGNIASTDSVELIKKSKPEVIFHLAADAYVPNSFTHPREVMESNLTGTVNVLHAGLEMDGIRRIVCTSSSEIYGTAQYAPIDEAHPLNPSSPYAASKVAADRTAYSYYNTFGLPVAIIRPFNTFGPRHTYDVIPKFIRLALESSPITVHGDGKQSRDFTYVDDMINAFLVMGKHPKAVGEAVNFGTGRDVNINETARQIKKISGSKSEIIRVAKRTSEVQRLICDATKARKLFGWKARVSFEEGLRKNIAWARQNPA